MQLKSTLLTMVIGAVVVAVLFSPGGQAGVLVGAGVGAISGLLAQLLVWRTSPRFDTIELAPAGQRRLVKTALACLAASGLLVILTFTANGDLMQALRWGFLALFASTLYLTWLAGRIEKKERRRISTSARRKSVLARRKR